MPVSVISNENGETMSTFDIFYNLRSSASCSQYGTHAATVKFLILGNAGTTAFFVVCVAANEVKSERLRVKCKTK